MPLQPPTVVNSSFWMWAGGLLASGIIALFTLLLGLTNSRITEAHSETKKDIEYLKVEFDKDISDLRALAAASQQQHLEMLRGLRDLPTRAEMQHDLEIMETRLYDRINNLRQKDNRP